MRVEAPPPGEPEQVTGQLLLPQDRVGDDRDGQQREDPAADRGAQARDRDGDQDGGDQQVSGQAGHFAEAGDIGRRGS